MNKDVSKPDQTTLTELLTQNCGKTVKFCLGENVSIQGIISEVHEDYVIIQREPVTIIRLDKIIWFQFFD
ncbi:hypothetical protein JXQ70_04230 [bacterium]|nr:hypothetical protein [bacterium]